MLRKFEDFFKIKNCFIIYLFIFLILNSQHFLEYEKKNELNPDRCSKKNLDGSNDDFKNYNMFMSSVF